MKFVDAFAGIGGFHLGITRVMPNAQCILAIENNKYCHVTYKRNFPHTSIVDNINTVQTLPKHDLFCAGFPCQPFSVSGLGRGFQDLNGTVFFDIVRLLKLSQPKYILLENVPRLQIHDNGNTFSIIQTELQQLGYNLSIHMLNSFDFALPQYRKRLFIFGSLDSIDTTFTLPTCDKVYLRDIVQNSIDDKYYYKGETPHMFQSKIIHNITQPIRIGSIKIGRQGERIYSLDGPAITLMATSGGFGGKTGMYKDHKGIRKLTPQECAQIQGFPINFIQHLSDSQSYKQLGNAVSVNVVSELVCQFIKGQ